MRVTDPARFDLHTAFEYYYHVILLGRGLSQGQKIIAILLDIEWQ